MNLPAAAAFSFVHAGKMSEKQWNTEELLDLEFFLAADDGEDIDRLAARDREIWLNLPAAVKEGKAGGLLRGYLKGLKFPVRLARQVFTNKDGSTGTLYLACSQLTADWNTITTVYKKRWNVEVFYKFLKSNAALAKSPAHRVKPQSNHIFSLLSLSSKQST
jgi:hypothetical protein